MTTRKGEWLNSGRVAVHGRREPRVCAGCLELAGEEGGNVVESRGGGSHGRVPRSRRARRCPRARGSRTGRSCWRGSRTRGRPPPPTRPSTPRTPPTTCSPPAVGRGVRRRALQLRRRQFGMGFVGGGSSRPRDSERCQGNDARCVRGERSCAGARAGSFLSRPELWRSSLAVRFVTDGDTHREHVAFPPVGGRTPRRHLR